MELVPIGDANEAGNSLIYYTTMLASQNLYPKVEFYPDSNFFCPNCMGLCTSYVLKFSG